MAVLNIPLTAIGALGGFSRDEHLVTLTANVVGEDVFMDGFE